MIDKFYNRMWNMKESFREDLRKAGDYLQLVTPIGFLLWVAWQGEQRLAQVFIITYLICGVIQILLKSLFNNPRPNEVEGTNNPNLNLDWSINVGESFPSGHTMSAMSGAMFWLEINPYVGAFGIFLGLTCGLSRIISKSHWLRDVLTSSVISAFAYYIAKTYYLNGIG
jgi:membrane-associated phospholipid phosphatase